MLTKQEANEVAEDTDASYKKIHVVNTLCGSRKYYAPTMKGIRNSREVGGWGQRRVVNEIIFPEFPNGRA